MWEKLALVRVYTKPKGKQPDYSSPVVLRASHCTVEDFCNNIHKEIAKQLKYAIVFGTSVKHSRGQKVGLDHVLNVRLSFFSLKVVDYFLSITLTLINSSTCRMKTWLVL